MLRWFGHIRRRATNFLVRASGKITIDNDKNRRGRARSRPMLEGGN